jgi:CheY-like chemotaxis protein
VNIETDGSPLSGVRVLVADYYEPLRWLRAHLLRKSGAEVLEASTGQHVLGILETGKTDVALLDSSLRDMPMVELRSKMRAMPAAASIPVVYTTSSELEVPPPDSEAFFREPINVSELVRTILLLLERATLSAFS